MNSNTLRQKHPAIRYKRFVAELREGRLFVRYDFLLEPDITFSPTVSIPTGKNNDIPSLEPFLFHLGLIELISYWKAACPPVVYIEAGSLNTEQVVWWHDLFLHGLGEFFYTNDIDFSAPEFLTIKSPGATRTGQSAQRKASGGKPTAGSGQTSGNLFMVGGGKDSAVTLALLKHASQHENVFLLNPTPAARAVTQTAGFPSPIIVERAIDPKLRALNKEGYLNGHTPFSAYLAFLGTLVAQMHGYTHLIASNESSASQGNAVFHGMEINHQYTKSIRFEKLFRFYLEHFLESAADYFSFLRPLTELQIAGLFSALTQYHPVFKSCNVGRGETWCGECPKCAFVYLILSPFLPTGTMVQIFGSDFFLKPELTGHLLDLAGIGEGKPFECVGTPEETKDAVALTVQKYHKEGIPLPPTLLRLGQQLSVDGTAGGAILRHKLLRVWNAQHFVPEEYAGILKEKLKTIL